MSELTAKRLKMYAPAPTPMAITLFTLQTETQPHHMTLSIIAVFRQRNTVIYSIHDRHVQFCQAESYRCRDVLFCPAHRQTSLIDVVECNLLLMDRLDFVTHFS